MRWAGYERRCCPSAAQSAAPLKRTGHDACMNFDQILAFGYFAVIPLALLVTARNVRLDAKNPDPRLARQLHLVGLAIAALMAFTGVSMLISP